MTELICFSNLTPFNTFGQVFLAEGYSALVVVKFHVVDEEGSEFIQLAFCCRNQTVRRPGR